MARIEKSQPPVKRHCKCSEDLHRRMILFAVKASYHDTDGVRAFMKDNLPLKIRRLPEKDPNVNAIELSLSFFTHPHSSISPCSSSVYGPQKLLTRTLYASSQRRGHITALKKDRNDRQIEGQGRSRH